MSACRVERGMRHGRREALPISPAICRSDGHRRQERDQATRRTHQSPCHPFEADTPDVGLRPERHPTFTAADDESHPRSMHTILSVPYPTRGELSSLEQSVSRSVMSMMQKSPSPVTARTQTVTSVGLPQAPRRIGGIYSRRGMAAARVPRDRVLDLLDLLLADAQRVRDALLLAGVTGRGPSRRPLGAGRVARTGALRAKGSSGTRGSR
jgi:hypothetical protein